MTSVNSVKANSFNGISSKFTDKSFINSNCSYLENSPPIDEFDKKQKVSRKRRIISIATGVLGLAAIITGIVLHKRTLKSSVASEIADNMQKTIKTKLKDGNEVVREYVDGKLHKATISGSRNVEKTYKYDEAGKINQIEITEGHDRKVLHYNSEGKISSITVPNNYNHFEAQSFIYNGDGSLKYHRKHMDIDNKSSDCCIEYHKGTNKPKFVMARDQISGRLYEYDKNGNLVVSVQMIPDESSRLYNSRCKDLCEEAENACLFFNVRLSDGRILSGDCSRPERTVCTIDNIQYDNFLVRNKIGYLDLKTHNQLQINKTVQQLTPINESSAPKKISTSYFNSMYYNDKNLGTVQISSKRYRKGDVQVLRFEPDYGNMLGQYDLNTKIFTPAENSPLTEEAARKLLETRTKILREMKAIYKEHVFNKMAKFRDMLECSHSS